MNDLLTNLDSDQIQKHVFNEKDDSFRVTLVGGEKLDISIDSDKIVQAIKDGISKLEFKYIPNEQQELVKQTEIQTIYLPQIIEKKIFTEIEKLVYIPQLEIKEIEKQVIVQQIEYKIIEVPKIIIQEKIIEVIKEINLVPLWKQICIILQTLAIIGLLITNLKR